ncbi:hypothetical protein EYF80_042964 [Liparis tanakae]|uniref:Fibronectin type-III domain-containing protein n=1 Tax=Liparis tanakae TaxID=230148 RepID=A0A4Z2G1U1_9TELE|nr:hypothetical protein EYF80_042964 [Liparis tanakae]
MERLGDGEVERWRGRNGEMERERLRDGEMEREGLGEGEVEKWRGEMLRDGEVERERWRDGEMERLGVRPGPPRQVAVRQKHSNWMVEWTEPSTASKLRLFYQVFYHRARGQGSPVLLNISEGSTSLSILGASLVSSQHYQVQVRSLVVPIHYEGIPSDWTHPVDWTSQEAIWSPTKLIYFTIAVCVAAAFLALYCSILACQRRSTLWMDSVPSPGKSKILSDVKFASRRTLVRIESITVCKVIRFDSASTCSSDALLWPAKERLEEERWKCEKPPPPAVKDTSSMSFSGPYIFCQVSHSLTASPAGAQLLRSCQMNCAINS